MGTAATAVRKPEYFKYTQPTNKIDVGDAFDLYRNPTPELRRVISLIRPPIFFSSKSYSTPLTLPIGLAYLAAALKKSDYDVQVIDCPGADVGNIKLTEDSRFKFQGLDLEEAIRRIDPKAEVIGVTIMFSQEWPFIRDFINRIRAAFPKAVIIVGGEHVTAMPEYSLRDCSAIDYIVTGEGELTMLELVHRLYSGKDPGDIGGVCHLDGDKAVINGLSPRLAKIDNMPWPAWEMFEIEPYFNPNFTMGIGHGRNMALLATRGCPYQCTFCSSPTMWTTRYTMRPVNDVVDEIEFLMKKYGANSIDFYDLTAIVKRDWIIQFMQELERRKVKIVWQLPSGTRSEAIDEEVIALLARTGCEFLVYAPESGSVRTLETIKKKVKLDRLEASVRTATKYKVVTKVNFIIGFPFETRSDVLRTLLFVWKLGLMKVDDCNIAVFSPYPGSELFNELVRDKVIPEINDGYFEDLAIQFDFTIAKSYCRHMSSLELLIYRVIGMSVFYSLSYVRSPKRILPLLKMMFSKATFEPRSLFEQRVFDFVVRLRQIRQTRAAATA